MATNRREFLKRLGAGAVALVGVRFLSGCEQITFESKIAGGLMPFMTPAEDGTWYWQSGNATAKADAPAIADDQWSLPVHDDSGLLTTLTLADLMTYAQDGHDLTFWKTMRCVYGANIGPMSTTLIANGIFTGIPLHRVLEDVGITGDTAKKVRVFGHDGFSSNIPIGRALDAGPSPLPPLLAFELNGARMSQLRGGPVRLVIPEMWGYKNVKWLAKLKVTADDSIFGTYETERFNPATNQSITPEIQRRIDDPGQIALGSVVSDPASVAAQVRGPDVTIAGASFAGAQTIEKVEVSLNGRGFEPAKLVGKQEMLDRLGTEARQAADAAAQTSEPWPWPNIWITWQKTFTNLPPGDYTATIRATDDAGRVQSADASAPLVIAPQVRVPFRVT